MNATGIVGGAFSWSYEVHIEGYRVRLYVGDEGIRRIQERP